MNAAREPWVKTLKKWKKLYPFAYVPSEDDQPMKPQEGESQQTSTPPSDPPHAVAFGMHFLASRFVDTEGTPSVDISSDCGAEQPNQGPR
jgi:hypothetical protein